MYRRIARALVCLAVLLGWSAAAVWAEKIYWTVPSRNTIQRAAPDGINLIDVVMPKIMTPTAVAVDPAAGKVYWTNRSTSGFPPGSIHRANLDGSDFEIILTYAQEAPQALALDVGAGKMYWMDSFRANVRRSNLDGTDVELLLAGQANGYGLALDSAAGKMYFTNTDRIQRANLDGSGLEDLVTGLYWTRGIALDIAGGTMYWIQREGGMNHPTKIARANLDGSDVEDLIVFASDPTPYGIQLDVAAGKMYWTEPHRIRRANLDGTNIETAATTPPYPHVASGLALDLPAGIMYWVDWIGSTLRRAGLNGEAPQLLVAGDMVYPSGIEIDAAQGKVYWNSAFQIQRADLDGSNIELLVNFVGGGPSDVALDLAAAKMYWTFGSGPATHKIQRANLDGSGMEDVVTGLPNVSQPRGIAVDVDGGRIYWANGNPYKAIKSANLDGSDVQSVVSLTHEPFGVAIDPVADKLYWSEPNGPKIRRADLNGSNVEDVPIDVADTLSIGDFALDLVGGTIFWAEHVQGTLPGDPDYKHHSIHRANLDGSGRQQLADLGSWSGAGGLAFDSTCCPMFGDISPTTSVRVGDCSIDVGDVLCAVAGFANSVDCPGADISPCGGNGAVDVGDILAMLGAFAGHSECEFACPP